MIRSQHSLRLIGPLQLHFAKTFQDIVLWKLTCSWKNWVPSCIEILDVIILWPETEHVRQTLGCTTPVSCKWPWTKQAICLPLQNRLYFWARCSSSESDTGDDSFFLRRRSKHQASQSQEKTLLKLTASSNDRLQNFANSTSLTHDVVSWGVDALTHTFGLEVDSSTLSNTWVWECNSKRAHLGVSIIQFQE